MGASLHCLHFQVATLENRYELLPRIQDSIGASGAWVTDFRNVSDSSVRFDLEAPAGDIPAVHAGLEALGLKVEPERDELLELFHFQIVQHPDRTLAGSLVVRFLSRECDIPALPPGILKAWEA